MTGPEDGTPIVFLHGVMFTREMWAPQRDDLASAFRVVTVDLPGHGERASEDFDLERAVDLVDRVMTDVVEGGAVVVGLSLGGYVATEYARRYSEKVNGLVISGSSANPVGLLGTLTRLVSTVARRATESRLVVRAAKWIQKRWVRSLDLERSEERAIVDAGFYPEQFGIAGFELEGRDFRAAFGSFAGPALILNGKWDLLNRLGEEAHAAAAADARVEVVDGAGHVVNLERPGPYADAVERFTSLERVPPVSSE